MKRSRQIALITMGAAGLTLTACEEQQVTTQIYETVQQCTTAGVFSEEQCVADFAQAEQLHAEVAPKYLNKADCEADFGAQQCETAPYETASGGSVFMPLMVGYMMGSMLSGSARSAATQPLYRSGDDRNGFRTGSNVKVGNAVGAATIPKSAAARPAANMRPTPRGGFGASARAFGSAGG
ncbi:DUF1190 domain-containing protein [Minwuia sp.]|uniref:DUF1190 domain-containing protein n=1 Tax=Minwuia sp. TaxID=2493630 RepID=UPI003A914D1B